MQISSLKKHSLQSVMQTTALQQQAQKYTAACPSYYTHLLSAGIEKTNQPASTKIALVWYFLPI